MKKIKIVVTGASGLLGRAIKFHLSTFPYFEVIGTALSRVCQRNIKLNLLDKAMVAEFIKDVKPHFIIHTVAEKRPEICHIDPKQANRLNVEVTKHLAECAKAVNSCLLYISTDYVFDGINSPYSPEAQPNPLNNYGHSKLEGEKILLNLLNNAFILRLPLLYGKIEYLEESAVTAIAATLLKQKENIKMDNWAIRYPTSVDGVADICAQMIEFKLNEKLPTGIYHYSDNEPYTKYQMALIISQILGMPKENIIPDNTFNSEVKRPYNCCLDTSKLLSYGINILKKDFSKNISDILTNFKLMDVL